MSIHSIASPAQRTGRSDGERSLSPQSPTALQDSRPSTMHKRRRRNARVGGHRELEALREAVEQWAQRLRRQLLHAALCNDTERIADELQAPPLVRGTGDSAAGDVSKEQRRRATASVEQD